MLSYQHDESGEWLALAVPARLLLVKRPNAPDSASRLWDALRTENSAQAVLDELTAGGLFSAPSFALLTWDSELTAGAPATLHAIVRGDISVQLETTDGPESVTGRANSTWVEHTFGHVTGFTASAATAAAESHSLPLGEGAVRTAQVSSVSAESATGKTAIVGSASGETATIKKAQVKPGKMDAAVPPQHASATGTAAKAAPPTAPVPVAPAPVGEETIVNLETDEPGESDELGEPEFGATVVRDADHHSKPAALPQPNRAMDGGPRIDLPTFITGPGLVPEKSGAPSAPATAPAPAPTTAVLPAGSGSGDHDGMTVMSGDIQKLRNSRKHRPGSTPGPSSEPATVAAPPATPTLYLLLPSGAREPLSQPILVGRSPSVTKVSGGQVPRLVSLGGADQDISRNHVHFQVEGDTVVVTDLHSRNGTLIVLPGKPPQKLRQGEPTSVIVGTVVDLGSGISLTVCED